MTRKPRIRTTIRRSEVLELRQGAGEASDMEQVEVCDAALAGDREAIQECVRVMNDAIATRWAPAEWGRRKDWTGRMDSREYEDFAALYGEGAAVEHFGA